MNKFTAIDVSYLRPSRTLETILLENKNDNRVVYVYNFDGVNFHIFYSISDILQSFNGEFEPEISFKTEYELDSYLANLNLKSFFNI
ncbi:MAG: hypothetical protein PSX81_05180 [bacterium]|nr:hypothetical protein [bacterium]